MNTIELKNEELQVGDIVSCAGITCTIASIAFSEPWEWRNSYYTEFTDSDGNYRSWKQIYDGGHAYRNIQDNQEEKTMAKSAKVINTTKANEGENTMAKTKKTAGVHFYNGNIKVGNMLTFNKLAGNSVLNGCKGSCGEHCKGCWNTENWGKSPCYCAKSYVQYGNSIINSHIVNTVAMREHLQESIEELNVQLKRKRTIKPIRIHASGEIETVAELKAWMWLAKENPTRPIYIYTKGFEIVDSVLTQTPASDLPSNLYINISIWHEEGIECYKKWAHIPTIRAFVYDDGQFDYNAAGVKFDAYCPAYKKDEKGKVKLSHELTCDKCKLCFSNKNKVLGCLSH